LAATAVSATQIDLSWTAATDNVGVSGYQLERCQGAGCTGFALVGTLAGANFSDTGLAASTSYSYRARATDAAGNLSGYSNVTSATTQTAPDTTPPTAPTVLSASVGSTSQIDLTWTPSSDDVAVTGYQIDRCQGSGCTSFAQIATSSVTSFSDTGLAASTTYRYRVRATDAAGNVSANSSIVTATTQAAPDTTPPTAPAGLAATVVSATQINLSWTAATDNIGVTGYQIDRCQGSGCTSFAQIATSTVTSFSNTGLAASTTYRYRVRATDAAGNVSANSSIVTATTAPDTTLPTTPTGLAATAVGATQINLTWNASSDNVGVTGYRVYRCTGTTCTPSTQIATSTATSYSNTGLTALTTYRYRVRAVDAAGNLSANSSIVTATTPAVPDTTLPTIPASLAATAVSATQINLSWTAATDNVGVSGYQLERCQDAGCAAFVLIATVAGTTFNNTGLAASTSYSYRVRASDAAGNLSGYSTVASATTPIPDTTPPTVPTGLTATAIGATLINLGWTAATDDVAVSGYQLERCQGAGCTAFALIATLAGASFNDTGRTSNTSYSYRVRATDATGNLGEYSNIASATTAAIPSYTTNFDLTENPISEGGVWHRANNFWTHVSTANGIAFGTNGITNDYDDSYALLSGFGPDQQAEAVVFRSPNLVRGITHEIELLLRFSDDASSARGYECLFNYQGDVQLVKWNGAPGDFTPLTIAGGAGGLFRELVSGDVIKATVIGNVISLYINAVLMGRATDSTFTSGQPGISFFTRPGGNSANLGITSYTVSSN